MKTLKTHWGKFITAAGVAAVATLVLYVCISAWAQTAPGLSIALSGTNQASLVVTNGASNGLYQIYFTEFLDTNAIWNLVTNGSTGQTNFTVSIDATESGFFKAVTNTNSLVTTLTVTIQSPTNGSTIY